MSTSEPTLSITLPVFHTVKRLEQGEKLLRSAIESLLAQTYRDFELIILDNISEDGTFEICQDYARRDSRVRLIRDTERRPPADGNFKLLSFARGKYLMHACDDDVWHPQHLERCMKMFAQDPDLDLVYTNFQYIDINNNLMGPPVLKPDVVFPRSYSPFCSACRYTVQRTPVPILIGVFRMEAYKGTQPFIEFDLEWKANADNLFMIRFFLRGYRCDFVDEPLFYYRSRARTEHMKDPGLSWLCLVKHQTVFRDAILEELRHPAASPLSPVQQILFHASLNRAFVYHSLNLLAYVIAEELSPDDRENHERMLRLDLLRKLIVPELDSFCHTLPSGGYDIGSEGTAFAQEYYNHSIEAMKKLLQIVRCAEFFIPDTTPYIRYIENNLMGAVNSPICIDACIRPSQIPMSMPRSI